MAATLEGASRGSSTYKFEGPEIEALAVSPQLVRWEELDQDHVDFLALDIAKHGQQSPGLVRRGANGKPELVAARHRRAAVLKINADPGAYGLPGPIPFIATYQALDEESAIRASFAENTGKPLTVMDLAQAASRFSAFDWDNTKIASIISTPWHKVSAARVSQLKSYIRLPHKVQSLLHRGLLPESAARAMLTMGLDAEAMTEMVEQVERGFMKPGEIVAESKRNQRAKGKRARRSNLDLRELLEGMESEKADKMLDWLDGTLKSDEEIRKIFADHNESDDELADWEKERGIPT